MAELHDEILQRLSHDFVRRMRNWSASTGGAFVTTSSAAWDCAVRGGYAVARMPVLLGEASDTQAALWKLAAVQQEVVTIFWLYEGRTLAWMARATPVVRAQRLGPYSFRQYLDLAHARLQVAFAKAGEAAHKRRQARAALL